MSQDERETWLMTAYMEIKDIPAKPFLSATAKARTLCDHPAKIIPAIIRESAEWAETLWKIEKMKRAQYENANAPKLTRQEIVQDDGERNEISKILAEAKRNLNDAHKMEETQDRR